jgi:hypothetical protein
MRFIEKIRHKFSYHFIIGAVAANLLDSVGSYGASLTDNDLISRTKEQYRGFSGSTLAGANQSVCPLLQFAWSLSERSDDLYVQQQVMLILSGQVWGIDPNRSANESETGVYYSLIARAKGVSKDVFHPITPDTTTVLGRHQLALAIAYDVIFVPAATGAAQPFVNYVTDRGAHNPQQTLSSHLGVKTK